MLRSQIEGAVLGAAIGDAIGHPVEFLPRFSTLTGYALYWKKDGKSFAPYTDDTQMAEAVLRALLDARTANADLEATMKLMAGRFVLWMRQPQGGHRAPGNACLAGCLALERGAAWNEAGGETAGGCGSVMRAYPFALIYSNEHDAERFAVEHSKLTHRDPIALAACAAMACGMRAAIDRRSVADTARTMIEAAARHSIPTAEMMARAHQEAIDGVEPTVTLDRLRGWAAHEAIAAALYVYARHPEDPRAAILEGANTPGDSDSIATLAGALTGAKNGIESLPVDWVRDVERSDDLLRLARQV
jgi:ADP-ribosylglycohydrolase